MPQSRYAALAALLLVVAAPARPARAAIVQTYADPVAFAGAGTATALSVGTPGAALAFFPTYGFGDLGVAARDGDLAGLGLLLSTELDLDQLVLTFARPVSAVAIRGLVGNAEFGPIGGTLRLAIPRQGEIDLAVTDAGSQFFGLRTDTPFRTLTIDVIAYDLDASSVAFATLDSEVGAVFAPASVGEPGAGGAMAMASMLAGLTALARRRRSATRAD